MGQKGQEGMTATSFDWKCQYKENVISCKQYRNHDFFCGSHWISIERSLYFFEKYKVNLKRVNKNNTGDIKRFCDDGCGGPKSRQRDAEVEQQKTI